MTQPTIAGLFSDAPPALQRVTVAPVARAARASGRRAGRTRRTMEMYRDTLLLLGGTATDHEVSTASGMSLSAINGRRNDWGDMVVAAGRQRIDWPGHVVTTRTRWQWRGPKTC